MVLQHCLPRAGPPALAAPAQVWQAVQGGALPYFFAGAGGCPGAQHGLGDAAAPAGGLQPQGHRSSQLLPAGRVCCQPGQLTSCMARGKRGGGGGYASLFLWNGLLTISFVLSLSATDAMTFLTAGYRRSLLCHITVQSGCLFAAIHFDWFPTGRGQEGGGAMHFIAWCPLLLSSALTQTCPRPCCLA